MLARVGVFPNTMGDMHGPKKNSLKIFFNKMKISVYKTNKTEKKIKKSIHTQ